MAHLKKLSILVVAAVAVMALVGVSSAGAAKFTFGKSGQTLSTETQEQDVFGVTGSTAKCTTSKLEGKTEGTESAEIKAHPVFTGCTAFGFEATMDTDGCIVTFKAPLDGAGKATVGLSDCTDGGFRITVNNFFAKCTVFIPNQSISSAVSYTNISGSAINILKAAAGITMHIETSDGLCPLTEGGMHSNGTWTGKTKVTATNGVQWDAI